MDLRALKLFGGDEVVGGGVRVELDQVVAWGFGWKIEEEGLVIAGLFKDVDVDAMIALDVATVGLPGLHEDLRAGEEHGPASKEEAHADGLSSLVCRDEDSPGAGELPFGVAVLVKVAAGSELGVAGRIHGAAGFVDSTLCENILCRAGSEGAGDGDDHHEQRALTVQQPLVIVVSMRLCHVTASLYITASVACGGVSWAEPAQPEELPRVLVVALPTTDSGETALATQLVETVNRAGLEAIIVGEEEIDLPEASVQELGELERRAEQQELALELGEAAARRREIVELLENVGATATQPGRLADALSRLAATEVESERLTEATRIWRRALALRADLSLDGTFSPSARQAFEQASEQGATLPPRPDLDSLERLCDTLDVEAVLWAAVGVDEGNLTVVRLLHRRGTSESVEVRHNLGAHRSESSESWTSVTLSEAPLDRLQRELSLLASLANPYENPPPPPPPRPWYRQWWFWTTVGVVVAGATATGLALGLGEQQVDMVVRFP